MPDRKRDWQTINAKNPVKSKITGFLFDYRKVFRSVAYGPPCSASAIATELITSKPAKARKLSVRFMIPPYSLKMLLTHLLI